jgi:hypothetical protein
MVPGEGGVLAACIQLVGGVFPGRGLRCKLSSVIRRRKNCRVACLSTRLETYGWAYICGFLSKAVT